MCGTFRTDISKAWTPEMFEFISAGTALGRVAEPHEVVGAALYLVSGAASYCTGSILRLDGGVK